MNVIDTTNLSVEETVSRIQEKIRKKSHLLKTEGLPGQVAEVISITSGLLWNQIVGMYLYGSYVLGGLRPDSDIDILMILKEKLSDSAREELTNELLLCSGRVGCREKRPLEVTIINQADTVIPSVLASEVRKAIGNSLPGLAANVKGDERKVLLTLARMWFTLETEEICPKDAAEWVIPRLPRQLMPLMELAVKGYRGECAAEWEDLEEEVLLLVDYLKNHLEQLPESGDSAFDAR